jgi:hypothetical protein
MKREKRGVGPKNSIRMAVIRANGLSGPAKRGSRGRRLCSSSHIRMRFLVPTGSKMGVYGAAMNLERGTGFEPATSCLEGRRSACHAGPPDVNSHFCLLEVAGSTV